VIRVIELLKRKKAERYKELTVEEWRVVRIQAVGSVKEVWEGFRGTILRILEEVCGLRTVGARERKGELWCTETAVAVRKERGICLVAAKKRPREY
jgi:hypothetical protein